MLPTCDHGDIRAHAAVGAMSMVLLHPGAMLMSEACVNTKGHEDVPDLPEAI